MKVKLTGGAEFEVVSPDDLDKALDRQRAAWQAEIGRGIDWVDISMSGTKNGAVWSLSTNTPNAQRDMFGPPPGFVWSILRLFVGGAGVVPGTDLFNIYSDEIASAKLQFGGLTRGQPFDVGSFVLHGGRTLAFAGAATGAGSDIWVTGQAIVLPKQLAWQLLGK